MFGIRDAYMIALPVSSVFFGIALVTFALSTQNFLEVPFKQFTKSRWALLGASILMMIVSVLGFAQGLRHNLVAFVYYKGGMAAEEQLTQFPRDPTNYIHSVSFPLQTFLGDSVLVYRTWIVCDRNWWLVAFLSVLLVGGLVGSSGLAYAQAHLTTGTYTSPTVQPWIITFTIITVVLNLICTGLISHRILKVARNTAKMHNSYVNAGGKSPNRLRLATRVMIESGGLYTLTSFLVFLMAIIPSLGLFIVGDSFIHIVPICFNLIVIRTSSNRQPDIESPPHSRIATAVRPIRIAQHTTITNMHDSDYPRGSSGEWTKAMDLDGHPDALPMGAVTPTKEAHGHAL